mmetsp:Transcript_37438/g.67676  ORF Transcript_37438/g.67676 Transcript_37438/m.67676 type:complete len:1262 (+) Transcript_37438:69-3854(+)
MSLSAAPPAQGRRPGLSEPTLTVPQLPEATVQMQQPFVLLPNSQGLLLPQPQPPLQTAPPPRPGQGPLSPMGSAYDLPKWPMVGPASAADLQAPPVQHGTPSWNAMVGASAHWAQSAPSVRAASPPPRLTSRQISPARTTSPGLRMASPRGQAEPRATTGLGQFAFGQGPGVSPCPSYAATPCQGSPALPSRGSPPGSPPFPSPPQMFRTPMIPNAVGMPVGQGSPSVSRAASPAPINQSLAAPVQQRYLQPVAQLRQPAQQQPVMAFAQEPVTAQVQPADVAQRQQQMALQQQPQPSWQPQLLSQPSEPQAQPQKAPVQQQQGQPPAQQLEQQPVQSQTMLPQQQPNVPNMSASGPAPQPMTATAIAPTTTPWLMPAPLAGHVSPAQPPQIQPPTPQLQPGYSASGPGTAPSGQVLGRAIRLPGPGEMDFLAQAPEGDLSSIHVLSPGPVAEKEENGNSQDILEHCRDTAKLVKQLASVLKGLEADVDCLRKENRSLRRTVMSSVPSTIEEPLSSAEPAADGSACVSLGASGTGSADPEDQDMTMVASQASMPNSNPLQTRSTPPPSARLAPPAVAAQERMLGLHASPHFGQAVGGVSAQPKGGPQTPSPPAKRSALPSAGGAPLGGSRGPTMQLPGGDWGTSPQTDGVGLDSTAIVGGSQDTSGMADTTAIPLSPPVEQGGTSGPWSAEQTIWLGGEGSTEPLVGKVRILDRETVISASAAVEGLNRGTFKCAEDLCVVYSASSRGYYLLYRQGQRDKAQAFARGEDDAVSESPLEAKEAPTARNPGGPSMGTCAVRVAAPQAAEPTTPGLNPEAQFEAMIEAAENNDVVQAEEMLRQAVRSGLQPTEACFDALILAFDRRGNAAKAEEWLWRALRINNVPHEASFTAVINAGCKQKAALKVEDTMTQMMHLRIRPPKEVFDNVIKVFSDQGNPNKVEHWLLMAGQSGWTPEQPAFESVVLLFANENVVKAEEWLRRSQETEYRLSDSCYAVVASSFVRAGDPDKAEEVLALMKESGRTPSDATLREVLALHAEMGNVGRAESLLDHLSGRSPGPMDELRASLVDTAIRAGDVETAERQLLLLSEPDAGRTQQVAAQLAEKGETGRAKGALEQYLVLGGEQDPEICSLLLSACASLGDAARAEAAAQMLMSNGPLNEMQASLLRHAVGDEQAEALMRDVPRRQGREAASARQPSQLNSGANQASRRNAQQRPSTSAKSQVAKSGGPPSPKATSAKVASGPRRSGPTMSTARGRNAAASR